MVFVRATHVLKKTTADLYKPLIRGILIRSASTTAQDNTIKYNKEIVIKNVDESQESPLVVIIGWSNSNLRQIEKYSQIYEDLGCTVVSSSMQLYRFSMFYDTLFAQDTQNVINAMTTQRNFNTSRKVFFKLFSTPGPAMYVNIMNYYFPYIEQHFGTVPKFQLSEDETKPNICGVIYDSATVESGNAHQFANGMRGNSTGALSNMVFNVLGKMVYAYAVRTSKMHNYGPEFLRNIPVMLPQMFLSSENDKIASIESVRNFVEHQKEMGVPLLKSKVWENSDHVLHYRKYPEEYKALVDGFMKECLDLSQVQTTEKKESVVAENKKQVHHQVEI
ncbi:transmembrane protein 53-B-like [Clytia hemisphaerica]|uniref:Uncharacterized protein n=1 Tax=Clytia hemisphaerica TaxID=252671 RepID=A0A7M6DPM6_9CNID